MFIDEWEQSKVTGIDMTDGVKWIRRLMVLNLGLICLQPISAGFILSGYAEGVRVHAAVATAVQFGVAVQAVTAIVLWWLDRLPRWAAGASIGLLVIAFVQVGLGYTNRHWLHVPIGVAIIGWLRGQVGKCAAPDRHDVSAR
jgi:hypothetical protein